MKNIFLTLIFLIGFSKMSTAQFEIKTNPILLLFAGVELSGEYVINPNFGLETTAFFIEDVGGIFLLGKYYLKPRRGADRFNFGALTGFVSNSVGIGFHCGTKLVSKHNVLFELSIGAARSFGDIEGFPYFKLDVGYRFGGKGYTPEQ